MRTAGAHHRRTYRDLGIEVENSLIRHLERLLDALLAEFAEDRELVLADDIHADILAVGLNDRIELLNDIDLADLCGKIPDQLDGQGIDHAELEDRNGIAERFFDILVRGRGGDDAEIVIPVALFHAVEGRGLGVFDQLLGTLFDKRMTLERVAGGHDVFLRILGVILGDLGALA